MMMKRKDCDKTQWRGLRRRGGTEAAVIVVLACAGVFADARDAAGASLRIWSTAIVVTEQIHVDDVCELRGFDQASERALKETVLGEAPKPGESLVIDQQAVREVLRGSGVNMATVTVSGASRCEVARPSTPPTPRRTADDTSEDAAADRSTNEPEPALARSSHGTGPVTLRQAVIDFFNDELARYSARAEIAFDRTSEQLLNLSGPTYTFRVRRRGGPPLGLIPVEVDVLADGTIAQKVPLVVSMSMVRRVVVARRSINQDATIHPGEVETMELTFNHTDKIGLSTPTQILGQRAKRFITAGSMIDLTDVESVPLVIRGQLVTLESVVGGIQVVSTAKATQDGLLGQTITVRATDNKRVEFDAAVVGVGRVRVGGAPIKVSEVNLAEAGS